MTRFLIQVEINGREREFEFRKLRYAEMEFRRYCGMPEVFSAHLWIIPDDEDREPYILNGWERS